MNKKIALLLLLVCWALADIARAEIHTHTDWTHNDHNVVVTQNQIRANGLLFVGTCGDLSFALADVSLPPSAEEKTMTIRLRVDDNALHTVHNGLVSKVLDDDGTLGMAVELTPAFLAELLTGQTLRVEYPGQNGTKVYERYSLRGFSAAYAHAHSQCERGFFPSGEADYFL